MPTYQYRCLDCGNTFDVSMSLREKEAGLVGTCPKCHSRNTKQVFRQIMALMGRSSATQNSTCGPACGPMCRPRT